MYVVTSAVVPSEYVAVTFIPSGSKLSPSVYTVFVGGVVTAMPVSVTGTGFTVIGVVAVFVTESSVYVTVISVSVVLNAPIGL